MSMTSELLKFDENGQVVRLGTITLADGKLVGDTAKAQQVLGDRIFDPVSKKVIGSDQAEAWLRALPFHLKSAYLSATEPKS